jgi:cell division protein ZapA
VHVPAEEARVEPIEAVSVRIFGEEYRIAGDGDPERIHDLARFVDEKMRAVRERMVSVHPAKVAVLASLNIADELLARQQETERSLEEVRSELARCRAVLGSCLSEE